MNLATPRAPLTYGSARCCRQAGIYPGPATGVKYTDFETKKRKTMLV